MGRRLALEARRMGRLGLQSPLDTEIWGLKLRLFPRGNISEARLLFMPQLLDVVERQALAREAKPGWVFADLGANVGSFTYWAASLGMEGSRILAVEPDPEIHATLRFNLDTNGLANVTAFAGAVADRSGSRTLEISQANRGESALRTMEAGPGGGTADSRNGDSTGGPGGSRSVTALSLRDLLDQEGIPGLDALKIDVEGGEFAILKAFFEATDEDRWPHLLITEWKGTREALALGEILERTGFHLSDATRLNRVYRRG
ncbi:FkbM family methyltransferase [Gemmatimonadota bacterium]